MDFIPKIIQKIPGNLKFEKAEIYLLDDDFGEEYNKEFENTDRYDFEYEYEGALIYDYGPTENTRYETYDVLVCLKEDIKPEDLEFFENHAYSTTGYVVRSFYPEEEIWKKIYDYFEEHSDEIIWYFSPVWKRLYNIPKKELFG